MAKRSRQSIHLNDETRMRPVVPGSFFVHPAPLFAVALMAFNDHWLKYHFPSWWTGKLSDFAGIFYLPIFLLACVSFLFHRKKNFSETKFLTHKSVLIAILFTDFLLVLVKLSAPTARWIEQFFQQYFFTIQLVQDPTDLIALSMNVLTFLYMKKYINRSHLAEAEQAQS